MYSVLIKILLATLLDHTGDTGINSNYYPIYYLPSYRRNLFQPFATLFWTVLTSLIYCAFLIPRSTSEYELTAEGLYFLAIRILFLSRGDGCEPLLPLRTRR